MTTLIPVNNGFSTVNGLPIRQEVVVIFDFDTLEILDISSTYNQADEIACDLYRKNIDARTDCLWFFDDSLNAKSLIGMTMNKFQHFVDNNKHPLITKKAA
jgi:hypothetical protein